MKRFALKWRGFPVRFVGSFESGRKVYSLCPLEEATRFKTWAHAVLARRAYGLRAEDCEVLTVETKLRVES